MLRTICTYIFCISEISLEGNIVSVQHLLPLERGAKGWSRKRRTDPCHNVASELFEFGVIIAHCNYLYYPF